MMTLLKTEKDIIKNGNPVYVHGIALDLAHTYYRKDDILYKGNHLSYTQTTFALEHIAKIADIRLKNKNQTKTE